MTYRISGEILGILMTGFMVFSDSLVDLDFRTGADVDRESVFFLSSSVIGGFLIVERSFLEFDACAFLF